MGSILYKDIERSWQVRQVDSPDDCSFPARWLILGDRLVWVGVDSGRRVGKYKLMYIREEQR